MIKEILKILDDQDLLDYTIKEIRKLELIAIDDPAFIQFVKENFEDLKNNTDQLFKSIWMYVKNNFRYVPDGDYKNDDELLISPLVLLSRRTGDCDDFSLFIKCVLDVLKIESDFILMGSGNNFSHIGVLSRRIYLDGASNVFNRINHSKYNLFAKIIFTRQYVSLIKINL